MPRSVLAPPAFAEGSADAPAAGFEASVGSGVRLGRRALLAGALALPFAPMSLVAQPATPGASGAPVPTPAPVPAAPAETAPLRLAATALDLPRGRPDAPASPAFGYNGTVPGPVLRIAERGPLDLAFHNGLAEPSNLVFRGFRGPNALDETGGLPVPVAPGETRRITVEARQAGTFLYGPLLPGRTGAQWNAGLHGVLIVEETAPPECDLDHVVMVGDLRVGPDGAPLRESGLLLDGARAGRLGNMLIVNGKPAPETLTVRPNARLRLRLVNVANARLMPLKVENLRAQVVAIDSTPCPPFDPLKRTIIAAPGARFDLLVDAPEAPDTEGKILISAGDGLPFLIIRATGDPLPRRGTVGPLPMPPLPAEIRLQSAVRVDLAISGGLPRDGNIPDESGLRKLFPNPGMIFRLTEGIAQGFSGKPLASVRQGQVLVIAIRNQTAWGQVLAIRGHAFRLLHPFDDGWEPYFLDSLYVSAGSTARVALVADNPGRWAVHSTILEHLDAGVCTFIEVRDR